MSQQRIFGSAGGLTGVTVEPGAEPGSVSFAVDCWGDGGLRWFTFPADEAVALADHIVATVEAGVPE